MASQSFLGRYYYPALAGAAAFTAAPLNYEPDSTFDPTHYKADYLDSSGYKQIHFSIHDEEARLLWNCFIGKLLGSFCSGSYPTPWYNLDTTQVSLLGYTDLWAKRLNKIEICIAHIKLFNNGNTKQPPSWWLQLTEVELKTLYETTNGINMVNSPVKGKAASPSDGERFDLPEGHHAIWDGGFEYAAIYDGTTEKFYVTKRGLDEAMGLADGAKGYTTLDNIEASRNGKYLELRNKCVNGYRYLDLELVEWQKLYNWMTGTETTTACKSSIGNSIKVSGRPLTKEEIWKRDGACPLCGHQGEVRAGPSWWCPVHNRMLF